jgi:hypothetical protein
LVSTANLALFNIPPASAALSPTLSGTVFEATASGPAAIAGAYVVVGWGDQPVSYTFTDANGRYLLCRVPPEVNGLGAGASGFRWSTIYLNLHAGRDAVVDIEMKRP